MNVDVTDNVDQDRFEAHVGLLEKELAGFVCYELSPGRMKFTYAEVFDKYEGEGVGSEIAEYALKRAKTYGLRVEPECPFIKHYIEEHAEYADLVVH